MNIPPIYFIIFLLGGISCQRFQTFQVYTSYQGELTELSWLCAQDDVVKHVVNISIARSGFSYTDCLCSLRNTYVNTPGSVLVHERYRYNFSAPDTFAFSSINNIFTHDTGSGRLLIGIGPAVKIVSENPLDLACDTQVYPAFDIPQLDPNATEVTTESPPQSDAIDDPSSSSVSTIDNDETTVPFPQTTSTTVSGNIVGDNKSTSDEYMIELHVAVIAVGGLLIVALISAVVAFAIINRRQKEEILDFKTIMEEKPVVKSTLNRNPGYESMVIEPYNVAPYDTLESRPGTNSYLELTMAS